jgi:hypothetical protein
MAALDLRKGLTKIGLAGNGRPGGEQAPSHVGEACVPTTVKIPGPDRNVQLSAVT